jgi:hypothetical protein
MVEVQHWNCLLKKLNVYVETRSRREYDKQPLKTPTSTTKFGYFPNGSKEKFEDYRCKAIIEWRGSSNCLQDYKIYGTVMKMFITKFLSNQPRKQCTSLKDVHMEMDQAKPSRVDFTRSKMH